MWVLGEGHRSGLAMSMASMLGMFLDILRALVDSCSRLVALVELNNMLRIVVLRYNVRFREERKIRMLAAMCCLSKAAEVFFGRRGVSRG